MLHELFVTQIDIDIRRTIAGRRDLDLVWHERRFFKTAHTIPVTDRQGNQRRLEPDSALLVQVDGQPPLLLFVELDNNSNMPLRWIRQKLRLYERWLQTEAYRFLARFAGVTQEQLLPKPRLTSF